MNTTSPPAQDRAPAAVPERAYAYLTAFRRLVVTAALVGAALAWSHELPWVAAALLSIGVGELLESSYYLNVLAWGERRNLCRRAA